MISDLLLSCPWLTLEYQGMELFLMQIIVIRSHLLHTYYAYAVHTIATASMCKGKINHAIIFIAY